VNPDRNRQPAPRWPFPGDTQLQRARRYAIAYRTHLHTANPELCAALDEAAVSYGDTWLVEQAVNVTPDQTVNTVDAAELAGVQPGTIHKWRRRGVVFDDGRRRLLATKGLSAEGWPMFAVDDVLTFAAATRRKRVNRKPD
jgi:hypothetical protein